MHDRRRWIDLIDGILSIRGTRPFSVEAGTDPIALLEYPTKIKHIVVAAQLCNVTDGITHIGQELTG